jgi:DNA polymerase-3 subunit delta
VKLRIEEFSRSLERGLRPFYLFYGDEPLLLQEAQDALRAAARAAGFTEREVLDAEPGFDWGRVHAACAGMSLFGDRKLLEIRVPSGKPGTEGGATLREIAARPSPDVLVVVSLGVTDRDTERAAWFKALDEAGASVRAWPLRREAMPGWIRQRLQAAGFRPDPEAVTLLVERVEGNLLAAKQEIEKLRLLVAPGALDAATLAEVVADSARYTAFDLCDRAFEGDIAAATRSLSGLRAEGEEPLAVLGALSFELRKLHGVAERHTQGEPLERAVEAIRGKRHYAGAIRRLGARGLHGLLLRAERVDRCVKGLEIGDPWEELLTLVIDAAGGLPAARAPRRP